MPVHYFHPSDRTRQLGTTLDELVESIEEGGEEIVASERFGNIVALFTRRTAAKKPAAKKLAAKKTVAK